MKVKEIFDFSNLKKLKIIAGKDGLEKRISAVSVIDAPDGFKWLNGGEFVITTAYIAKDSLEDLKDLIIKAKENGAVAFGIKIDRYIKSFPDKVIKAADELAFPIIDIPNYLSFAEIINTILTSLINKQAYELTISEKIHKSFTDLVIKGGDTQEIIDNLQEILNKSVAFYDNYFKKVYIGSDSEEFRDNIKKLSLEEILCNYRSYPLNIKNKVYGYIITIDNKAVTIDKYEEIALEHAVTVLILDIQKKISRYQIQTKYRTRLIQDIIFNNINSYEEVKKRASLYNWFFDKAMRVLIVDIDDFKEKYFENRDEHLKNKREEIFNISIKFLKNHLEVFYTTFSDKIIFLVKIDKPEIRFNDKLKKTSAQLRKKIKSETGFTVILGIGSQKNNVMDIYLSFEEAKKAVKLGRKIYGGDHTVFYKDLGVYKLFDKISKSELKRYYQTYIGKIQKYDCKNNTDLLLTLETLIENDWNMKASAERLYIHYNTIKYRVKRINKILNINTNDPHQKFNINLAVKAKNMLD